VYDQSTGGIQKKGVNVASATSNSSASMLDKHIAFVGAGQMAEALAKGFLSKGIVQGKQVHAYDISEARRTLFADSLKVNVPDSNNSAVRVAEVVLLAVKPQYLISTMQSVDPSNWEGKLVVSIAAGITIDTLKSVLPASARVVRIMPNTPCLVGESASAIAVSQEATPEDQKVVESLFKTVGMTIAVEESYLDAVTGLSGSGPAYVFLTIEALSDGGVRAGLPRPVATKLAAQTVMGAAKMVLETGRHPGELKDMVTSPAGTTISGVHALEDHGIRAAFIDAVHKATLRSKELSKL
jgi:pyrroline-5-carboxylate reductase